MTSSDSTPSPIGGLPEVPMASGSSDHPIGDLVDQLLGAVQAVVSDPDHSVSSGSVGSLRPAEFCYELDSVISQYLEHNELSLSQYEHIQQQVVNTLAHQLSDGLQLESSAMGNHHGQGSEADALLALDHHGNADMADVLSLLDHHFSADLHPASHDLALGEFHGDAGLPLAGHG